MCLAHSTRLCHKLSEFVDVCVGGAGRRVWGRGVMLTPSGKGGGDAKGCLLGSG